MTLRLLAVGDIHLGRLPGSVPAAVASSVGGRDELGPRAAWQATVDRALAERAQAVLLLGDVVDDEERYLEGWSALETGLRRLIDAGIEVVAVAGNHDVRVLPRLARNLRGLQLLGEEGRWQSIELAQGSARLVGWSYPNSHPRADPTHDPRLAELCASRCAGPTIGLMHGDLDAARGDYAFFSGARLAQSGADAWLLGHVHGPTFARGVSGRVSMGYLGSLTALDPTETGVHGPWLLEFEGRELVTAEQLALAPLRWERIQLPVDEWTSIENLEEAAAAALRDFEARASSSLGSARAVGMRIELVGACTFHRELRAAVSAFECDRLRATYEGRAFFVDSIVDRARPKLDLRVLAKDSDPPGILARRLLALDADCTDVAAASERALLLRNAREARAALLRRTEFIAVAKHEPSDEELARELRDAGLIALDELLASRVGATEGA